MDIKEVLIDMRLWLTTPKTQAIDANNEDNAVSHDTEYRADLGRRNALSLVARIKCLKQGVIRPGVCAEASVPRMDIRPL